MRKISTLLALPLLCLTVAVPALAEHGTLSCAECRDVREHPKDFGNYAFNLLIEPLDDDFSIFTTYSASAYVWNRQGQWALVLLDDVLEDTGASALIGGFSIPIRISSEFVKIRVQGQFGGETTYQVIETSRPLVVGDNDTAPPLPPPPSFGAKPATSGEEIVCCQDGAYYWYYDQVAFSLELGNE